MASVDAGAALLGTSASVHLRAVPPPVWVLLVAVLGAFTLMFHRYRNTPDDVSWTDPEQPADNLPVGPAIPAGIAAAAQGGVPGMRGRRPYRFTGHIQPEHCAGAWTHIPTSGRPAAAGWAGGR